MGAWACALALAAVAGAAPADLRGAPALDWAFKFASAIEADPKDMAKAQESVVREYAALGRLDEAARRADAIRGWRRGTAYADLAADFVAADRKDEATALVRKAENFGDGVPGWERARISARVARAWALLGDTGRSRKLAEQVAADDPRQYLGPSAATVATALTKQGRFGEAMERLAQLDTESDFDLAWPRTVGYLEIAQIDGLSRDERARALDAARRSAAAVPGWKSGEGLVMVAEEYAGAGERKKAREALAGAQEILVALPGTIEVKAPLVGRLAAGWAQVGEKKRGRDLLARVETEVPETLVTRQPAAFAEVAAGYLALGDEVEARRAYDVALAAAAALENSRPRALAVVAICNSMGRAGLALAGETSKLDALYAGLGDPW